MSYKVIEKNEHGIRVRNYSSIPDCNLCRNFAEKSTCKRSECAPNSYYLSDSEVEKLEFETDLKEKKECEIYISDEEVREHIENALYSSKRFLTTECTDLALGIIQYIKEANISFIKNQK